MNKITKGGIIAGFLSWTILIVMLIANMDCANGHGCDRGDLIIYTLSALGKIGPAYIAALFISAL